MLVEGTTTAAPGQSQAESPEAPGRPIDPDWAWAPFEPDSRRPWDLVRAGHLFRRAGFGAGWAQLQQALADGPQRAVQRLLEPDADPGEFNATYDRYAAGANGAVELRAWWLRRMILSPHPLLEKMTLFWHNHFGISNHRVNDPRLMQRHVATLRSHALGSYASMTEAVCRDPAVLLGLGSDASRKAQPNDRLARGLFGRFSLGDGHYTEEDVHEAARAMSGWFVLQNRLRFIEREHDPASKKIFGQQGPWHRDDVVRIALAQPATPRRIARKLYAWLISETDDPSDAVIAPLAESFARDYDIAKLVRTMLRSNLFFSDRAYRRRIKGPVEWAVGIVRGLEGMVSTWQLGTDLAALGQDLYHPPTVKGWPGGPAWISEATLVGRANLAGALLGGQKPYGDKLNPRQIADRNDCRTPDAAARFFIDLFLEGDVPAESAGAIPEAPGRPAADDPGPWLRRFVHGLLCLPEFQLA